MCAKLFTHRGFFTQTLLHTDTFTLYTLTLLHTDLLTRKHFYVQMLFIYFTHKRCYTQTRCAQTLLHTEALTHKALTHTHTQTRLYTHTHKRNLTPNNAKSHFSSCRWNLISCDRVAPAPVKTHIARNFCPSNLISCKKVAADHVKSQVYLSFCRPALISCESVAFRDASLAPPPT